MALPSDRPRLALIAGPTASGKSALALRLAERHRGTIINADSAQVYRDLRVLSARPSAQEEARAPHRLFGYIDGAERCSAARWARDAGAAVAEVHAADRLPILVGGTGLYLRTLLDGIAPIPEIDPDLRRHVRAMPVAEAHAALLVEDSEAAARLRPADITRIARALEVVRSTGTPIAEWQQRREGGIGDAVALMPLILLPDRDWLRDRCDRRFADMLDDGAIDEALALDARVDLPPDAPVRRAIGVDEIVAWQRGDLSRDEALTQAQAATRQYAKRQYTWFRRQPPAEWQRRSETETNELTGIFERLFL